MMRSLYSGVTGLKNHQTRMDVIGNNIANVNTAGYKSSRVIFSDIYSQTSASASAPNGTTAGGSNARQIGLGVNMAAIDIIHTSAATAYTDRELDLAIEGDGFFVIQMPSGQYMYTRAGNMYLDSAGNLVTEGGNFVLGVQPEMKTYLVRDAYVDDNDSPDDITDDENVPAHIVTDANGILDASALLEGDLTDFDDYLDDDDKLLPGYRLVTSIDPGMYEFKDPTLTIATGLYDLSNITTTLRAEVMAKENLAPLNLSGFYGIAIDNNGIISGLDENSERVTIAVMTIATFTNTGGLEKKGNNLYAESVNSGAAEFQQAQTGAAGKINQGGLEMSNVDLSTEFTDMIVTQRGFQANSRIITVSDTLLEELINLKR